MARLLNRKFNLVVVGCDSATQHLGLVLFDLFQIGAGLAIKQFYIYFYILRKLFLFVFLKVVPVHHKINTYD